MQDTEHPYVVVAVSDYAWAESLLTRAWYRLVQPHVYGFEASTWWHPLGWAYQFGVTEMIEAELKRIKTRRAPIYKKDLSSLASALHERIETCD